MVFIDTIYIVLIINRYNIVENIKTKKAEFSAIFAEILTLARSEDDPLCIGSNNQMDPYSLTCTMLFTNLKLI